MIVNEYRCDGCGAPPELQEETQPDGSDDCMCPRLIFPAEWMRCTEGEYCPTCTEELLRIETMINQQRNKLLTEWKASHARKG